MKNFSTYMLLAIALLLSACRTTSTPISSAVCSPAMDAPSAQGKEWQLILDDLVKGGVPGVALVVLQDTTWWTGVSGFAKIEDQTRMQPCHLQYLQSIAKLYLAVGILKLYEEGKINLDAPITTYLTPSYSQYISRAESITVRILLNHSSGIPEYNQVPSYVTYLLQNPNATFSQEDYLRYINKKPLDFEPGSKYSYRNTNYILLSLIADNLTGDHARYLDDIIFKPLQLRHTYYRGHANYLNYPELVNTYWDRYSDGIVENNTLLQRNNVAALMGDDGIVATPEDAVKFLHALMEGRILQSSTLDMMKTWMKDSKGNNRYGLGLDYASFAGQVAYGHSGGGLGAGCQLYYVPEKNTYFFIGINLGTVTASPLHKVAEPRLEQLYKTILN